MTDKDNPHRPPKPGDGTRPRKGKPRYANWYGPALEPQEEFTEDSPPPVGSFHSQENGEFAPSDGKPTFYGPSDREPEP